MADAEGRQKGGVVRKDFPRRLAAVKFAEQAGDGFDDERIRIAVKKTFFSADVRDEPKFSEATGNQIFFNAQFRRERGTCFDFFNEKRKPILSVF